MSFCRTAGGGGFPPDGSGPPDLEAVVRPVVHPVVRPMAMDLVVAARPMEASILQRFGPVGGPPGLTPSSASDAREFSRPIFVDFPEDRRLKKSIAIDFSQRFAFVD